jgi:N-methylhydantoinase A
MYNLKTQRPAPLSPRRLRFEVDERVAWDGSIERRPTAEEVRSLAERLRAEVVQAVAICFLFSYLNDSNERAVAEQLRELGDWQVVASHEIARQVREDERVSTTVMNGYVAPRMLQYMEQLKDVFEQRQLRTERVSLIGASGGVMSWEAARKLPVNLLDSGPAGGVRGAVEVARILGMNNVITCDMGGTSTDVALVSDLDPVVASSGYLGRHALLIPRLDISTIGAGGGSIAWIDLGGELEVGPRSAGAWPGPASYGRGGTEPTVTDADVVLGRFPPGGLLGGPSALDGNAARRAVQGISEALPGASVEEVAEGIVRVAVAKMTSAIREVSVARGLDPREFALVAYGGMGPMHATEVAAQLDMPTVVIPPMPGSFSAFGLIMSDMRHDHVQTRLHRTLDFEPDECQSLFAQLEREATEELLSEGFPGSRIRTARTADMRYVGQWFELNVPIPDRIASMEDVDRTFRRAHERRFGIDMPRPTEFVNFRVAAYGMIERPTLSIGAVADPTPDASAEPHHMVLDGEAVVVPRFRRERLPAGFEFVGPAVIEEYGATTFVSRGYGGVIDPTGSIIIRSSHAEAE